MKKAFHVFSMIMASVLVLCMLGMSVSCDDAITDGGQEQTVQGDLTFYERPDGTRGVKASETFALTHVDIPSTHDGVAVTTVMPGAFMNQTTLKSVTLPDSITFIGSMAFAGCTGFESITVPNGVATIDALAFANCSYLSSITLPVSVKALGEGVFGGCTALESIVYAGTSEQWNAIEKGNNWDLDTGEYTIYFTDGGNFQ